jgi:tRNA threonylcarbamoyladenosine biosynthesis protein TsaE
MAAAVGQQPRTSLVIDSGSARQTQNWARRLGELLEGGELIGLTGKIGAGKTCFVKGLALGLGLQEKDILSPTFTMIQEHHGRLNLFHIDLYRLDQVGIDEMGLREYLFSDGVAAVEWFEQLREASELECLLVRVDFAADRRRKIRLSSFGARYDSLIRRLGDSRSGSIR